MTTGICVLQRTSGIFKNNRNFRYSLLTGDMLDQCAPIFELENMDILSQSHSLSLSVAFLWALPSFSKYNDANIGQGFYFILFAFMFDK